MSRLAISLFGSYQVILDGKPVSGFVSKKAQALLAFLVVELDRPHQREKLAGLLWPDYPESSARTNLRSVLANLRRVIGDRQASPPYLMITRETIGFNRDSSVELDISLFSRLATAGTPSQLAVEQLENAVALYQGPFLAGFSLADSSLFEEWTLLRREQFGRQMAEMLDHLAGYFEQQGAYDHALTYARRRVDLDPWQEAAHQQVMRLLMQSGRRSEALAQYEVCRRVLAKELEVEPTDETTGLYEQIRAGELDRDANGAQDVTSSPRHNLPLPLTPLIGREEELEELLRLLTDPERRLITVVGPGGIGKTRLAVEVAVALKQQFSHGVYLVSLASLQSTEAMVPAIAKALRFSFFDNDPPEQQLLDYLKQKQLLLLLDNFEHLLEGASLVIDMLKTVSRLKILVTSRVRLGVRSEQLYPLSGLTYPAEQVPSEIASLGYGGRYGAVSLFEQSARRIRPEFNLTGDNLADVIRVCRLVEGMPLGILLATTWIEMLQPGEIAAEVERSFDFLQVELQDLPRRQQSLRSVFEHSWKLLAPPEQAVLARLSIFRGGFTVEAAQAVTGAALPELLTLTNKFLVHRTPEGRYDIHELLRQFAAEKLAQSPAAADTSRDRYSAYFATFMSSLESDLKGARQPEALTQIEAEYENIHSAWTWAIHRAQVEHVDQAVDSMGYFHQRRGRFQNGEIAFRAAAEKLNRISSSRSTQVLAKVLTWQAIFSRLMGYTDQAAQLVQQSLHLVDSLAMADQDTRSTKAAVYLEIGLQSANSAESKDWLEQGLALCQLLDDPWGTSRALFGLGHLLINEEGSTNEGRRLLEESFRLCQSLGNQDGSAEVMRILGFNEMLQSQDDKGETLLRRSLAIHREMNEKAATATSLNHLALGLTNHGRFAEAHRLGEEMMRISQDLGNRPLIADSALMLAKTNRHLGYYERAHSLGQMGLELYRDIDDPYRVSFVLWELGDVALGEGNYAEAEQLLQESVAIHQELGYHRRIHDLFISLGFVSIGLGNLAQARQYLARGLPVSREYRYYFNDILIVLLAALLAAKEEDPEQAAELYALAKGYPFVADSRWFEDIVGRPIDAVATSLPPEVALAAQARGKARDLAATVLELAQHLKAGDSVSGRK